MLTCSVTSVTITASSTTAGVNYNWGIVTTSTNTVTFPAVYSVTVTDPSNGCTASASATVSQDITPPNLSITPPTTLSCAVTSVTITASSTTAGVTYNWGTVTTATNTVTSPGNYSVTITDLSNSCTASASATVSQTVTPPNVSIATPATLTCTLTSIAVTASSTTAGVTYNWGTVTTATNTVTAPGNYSVTVTDPSNGCTASASATISQDITVPNLSIAPPATLTCAVTSVTISASSTTAGVTYNWGTVTTATNTITAPGNYSVTDTDPSNGCTASASVSESQDITVPNLSIAPPAILTCSVTSVTITASSTTAGVTYNWGTVTTATNTVTSPGTYSVTVTDPSNGCTASASVSVSQDITVPNLSIAPPATLTCSVTSVTVTASSTTTGVTYNWGTITTSTNTVTSPGTYSVTVTDPSNGCTASASATVSQTVIPPNVSIATPATLTCAVTSVTVTASSTTAGVTYNWGTVTTATNTVTTPGNYSVTVTDPSNGCTASASASVSQNITVPNVSIAPPATLTCAVTSVTITAFSTTTGVTYNWGTVTTSTNTVTTPGNYSVTVTDPSNGCTASASAIVSNTSVPVVSLSPVNILCYGLNQGQITSSVQGGVSPYSYLWNNGATAQNLTGAAAGTYSVAVTDHIGCTAGNSATITEPTAMQASETSTDDSCYNESNGTITTNVTGGTPQYFYLWNDGATTSNRNALAADTYIVTITDNNSCSTTLSALINQPPLLSLTETQINITCFGDANGALTLATSGGTPAYMYLWSDGNTNANRANLVAGVYNVTVTDSHLCKAVLNITLPQPLALVMGSMAVQPACANLPDNGSITLNVTNGTSPYTYSWTTGATTNALSGLSPGNYSVTVNDINNCSADTTFELAYQYAIGVNATPSVEITMGSSTTLGFTVTGNSPSYTYVWSPSYALSCINCENPVASPEITTTYQIEVTNSAGCVAIDKIIVTVTPDYDVFVPNAFTPNGDGNNDFFQIYGNLAGIAYMEIQVFNRWGEKVFQSNDYNFKWDGTYKGVMQDPAVFVWVLKITWLDGHLDKLRKGSVTLLR
jgi:gliding motility-associated-like protein